MTGSHENGTQMAQTRGKIGHALNTSRFAKICEILFIFAVALIVIVIATRIADGNPLVLQALVWTAYLFMLAIVWAGLRLRGQTWKHLGLTFKLGNRRTIIRAVLKSLVVLLAAVAAFVLGSIVGANIVGIPEQADMS
ncbi:MAG: hypothetical protein OEM82_12795, partial [Acidobacteriota bacterium]|nr:hypothetical protein [Acidobacteriota bacterium]